MLLSWAWWQTRGRRLARALDPGDRELLRAVLRFHRYSDHYGPGDSHVERNDLHQWLGRYRSPAAQERLRQYLDRVRAGEHPAGGLAGRLWLEDLGRQAAAQPEPPGVRD